MIRLFKLIKCSICGKTWDTINPCALCYVTKQIKSLE